MEQLLFSMGLLTPLIQYCRVISSRMIMPYLLSVFNLTLSGLDVCLDWYLHL